MNRLIAYLICAVATIHSVQSQQRVEYTNDFNFQNGIYLSFKDFKNNNPIPLTHIISDFDIRDPKYLNLVLASDSLFFYDNLYEERSVSILDVWGYSQRGKVSVGFNTVPRSKRWDDRSWFPLISIGAYSYFTAQTVVSHFVPPTPGAMMQSRGTILDDGSMITDEGSYYDESVPIHMLLDFNDGSLIELAKGDLNTVSVELMSNLLQSDAVLLAEYEALPKREQKQSSVFYLRRYNQRNPIFLPVFTR